MDTKEAIVLARKHVDNGASMSSSALLCLSDAIELYDNGDFVLANANSVHSLAYSVGVFHNDYKRAAERHG